MPTIDGTSGPDTLTGTLNADDTINAMGGNDTINATSGTDTVNGGTGNDKLVVDMQDAAKFTAVAGTITYTVTGTNVTGAGAITSSTGGLNTTVTGLERMELHDVRSDDITLNIGLYGGNVIAFLGAGNDTVNISGTRSNQVHVGLGSNTVTGGAGNLSTAYVGVDSSQGFAVVGSGGAGIDTISYTLGAITYTTTLNQVGYLTVESGVAGQGYRVDATGAARSAFFADSLYNDYIIATPFDDAISEISATPFTNLSTGLDYKVGNGGADTFDYTVAAPLDFTDHILDFDSNDVIDLGLMTSTLGGDLIWLGTGAFTHTAREFRYQTGGGNTVIQFDYNGDGNADAAITIDNGEFALEKFDREPGWTNVLRIAAAQNQNMVAGDMTANANLTGTAGMDVIRAYDGNDTVRATAGQDFADGGRGTDALLVVMSDAGFAAPTGSRTYTIDADRVYDSSGAVNTSFLNFESITLSLANTAFGGLVLGGAAPAPLTVTGTGSVDAIQGSAFADTLLGNGSSDVFYASPGADTIDGGNGATDKIVVESTYSAVLLQGLVGDNYTITANKLTNGAGTLNTTFTSVERIEVYDYRAGNTTVDASAYAGSSTVLSLGDGNHTVIGSNVARDNIRVGIGNSTIDGGTNGSSSALVGTGSAAPTPVIVGGTAASVVGGAVQPDGSIQGGTYTPSQISFTYSSGGNGYVTTVTNAIPWVFSGSTTSGLYVDASNAPLSYIPNATVAPSTYTPFGLAIIDSLFDDVEIGSRYADRFAMANAGSLTVNGGTDYMTGGGGADIYDYEAAINLARNDYILDFDADDQISFSYFGTGLEPHFIGTAAFTHTAREIRYEKHDGHTYIQVDVDGDGVTDGTVTILNGEHDLKGIDFYGLGNGTNDTLMLDEVQNIFGGGNTADTVNGTAGVDILRGYDGNDTLSGFAGNDTLDGGTGNDLILPGDGTDTALGGDGNDGIVFGAFLDPTDTVDGGAGTNDQVGIQGNYAGLTLGANNLTNIEALVLLPGNDTRFGDTGGNFYSYNLTTVDANVNAGQLFVVNWNTLRSGENVTFNGSAETNGSFLTYGGAGNDTITGGQQVDGFYFGGGKFGAGDVLNGGGGNDQLGLQGDYSGANAVTFGAGQLTSIESIIALSGADTRFGGGGLAFSYTFTMNDANVAAGVNMIINANTLRSNEVLTFNGGAETNGSFSMFGGAGNDVITTGAGNDTIYGGAGADTLTGGAGNDTYVYLSAAHSTVAAQDHIVGFGNGADLVNLSNIDAIAGTGANDAFTFIGSAAFSNVAGQLRAYDNGGGTWYAEGDTDGDGVADLSIAFDAPLHALTAADFVL